MEKNSTFDDFVEIMAKVPWWVNVALAAIAYVTLHSIAMTFYDPVAKLEIGQFGDFTADKMKGSLALFGQFLLPFAFLMAGLVGLVNKFKTTGKYKELIIYVVINIVFFGAIIAREDGINSLIKNRIEKPREEQQTRANATQPYQQPQIKNRAEKPSEEQQARVNTTTPSQQPQVKEETTKQKNRVNRQPMYSWVNEKGIRTFSNVPPQNEKYTDLKIEY